MHNSFLNDQDLTRLCHNFGGGGPSSKSMQKKESRKKESKPSKITEECILYNHSIKKGINFFANRASLCSQTIFFKTFKWLCIVRGLLGLLRKASISKDFDEYFIALQWVQTLIGHIKWLYSSRFWRTFKLVRLPDRHSQKSAHCQWTM